MTATAKDKSLMVFRRSSEPEVIFEGRRNLDDDSPLPLRSSPFESSVAGHAAGTVIAAGTRFEGVISATGTVVVQGTLIGDIEAEAVAIEKGGRIQGRIAASEVKIAGELNGAVDAREIDVVTSAQVDAELTYDEISIERGARVRGIHKQRDEVADMVVATTAVPESVAPAAADNGNAPVIIGLSDLKGRLANIEATVEAIASAAA